MMKMNKEEKMTDIINDNFNELAIDYYKLQENYEQLQQENEQLKERINKAIEYIESIKMVKCKLFDYNRFLKEHLISLEELRKKVEEDGTLEGHFVEINKDKLLEILKGDDNEEKTDLTYLSSLTPKFGKTQAMINQLQEENKQLKERINKVIDHTRLKIARYINEQEYLINVDDLEELLEKMEEILKGDDNE